MDRVILRGGNRQFGVAKVPEFAAGNRKFGHGKEAVLFESASNEKVQR